MTDDDKTLACQIFSGIIYILKKYDSITKEEASELMEQLNQIAERENQPIYVEIDHK